MRDFYANLLSLVNYRECPAEAADVAPLALAELNVVDLVEAEEVCQAAAALRVALGLAGVLVGVLVHRAVQL